MSARVQQPKQTPRKRRVPPVSARIHREIKPKNLTPAKLHRIDISPIAPISPVTPLSPIERLHQRQQQKETEEREPGFLSVQCHYDTMKQVQIVQQELAREFDRKGQSYEIIPPPSPRNSEKDVVAQAISTLAQQKQKLEKDDHMSLSDSDSDRSSQSDEEQTIATTPQQPVTVPQLDMPTPQEAAAPRRESSKWNRVRASIRESIIIKQATIAAPTPNPKPSTPPTPPRALDIEEQLLTARRPSHDPPARPNGRRAARRNSVISKMDVDRFTPPPVYGELGSLSNKTPGWVQEASSPASSDNRFESV